MRVYQGGIEKKVHTKSPQTENERSSKNHKYMCTNQFCVWRLVLYHRWQNR